MPKIWFEREIAPALRDAVPGDVTILGPAGATPATRFAGLDAAQGIVASVLTYDAAVMALAPALLVISRTGVGYDNVDVAAATRAGIAVCNAPDGPTISTAEHTIALMLAVAKNVKAIENELRRELQHGRKRHFYKDYQGIELNGKTLGLVGCGRIGSRVAAIAKAVGMTVIVYDPFLPPNRAAALDVALLPSLTPLLSTADIVSLHLPLTADTRHLMNAARFAQMKPGAIFVNCARGGLVDEAALLAALDDGRLFGAALDVTDPEPPRPNNPLLARDNVIITPHIASGTAEGKHRNFQTAVDQARMVILGPRPPHLLNPEAWPHVLARRAAQRGR